MAPFGRNFLKARFKNRCKQEEPTSGTEVQVWVCGEEKVVCGATKRTTCADVVQALLDDQLEAPEDRRLLQGEPREYCLLERWKGFERALPPLTRILRLCEAWGDERPIVQFALAKAGEYGAPSGKRPGKTRLKRRDRGPAAKPGAPSLERQKRMVKKAFRKLEKIQTERTPQEKSRIHEMVQLIISQDHTIQEQVERMRELDVEVERVERQLQMEGGLCALGGIGELDLLVKQHWDLIEKLSRDIEMEMRKAGWSNSEEPPGAAASAGVCAEDSWLAVEQEKVRRDLGHSMHHGLFLHGQTTELEKELKQTDMALCSMGQECEWLAAQLSGLQSADSQECEWLSAQLSRLHTADSQECEWRAAQLSGLHTADSQECEWLSAQLSGLHTADSQECEWLSAQLSGLHTADSQECEWRAAQLSGLHTADSQECEWLSAQLSGLHSAGGPVLETRTASQRQARSCITQGKLVPTLSPTQLTDTDSDTGISSTHSQDSLSPCGNVRPPLDTDV